MSERFDTPTADTALPRKARAERGWRLIQRAPGPETPDVRSKAATQRGMIIALGACTLFWGAVAAGVAYLMN
jgi:hypothetical protein